MPASNPFEQVVMAAGDAILVSDAAGAITLWNPAAERMFGYTAAEALGQSLNLICPERLRHRHWEGYHHSMATGTTRYGTEVLRVPGVDKAGRAMSLAFTVAMLRDQEQRVTGVMAILRDETRRFAEERALRKRLGELEQQLAAP